MNNFRNFAVWIVIAILLFALFSLFQGQATRSKTDDLDYSQFLSKVNAGEVQTVTITDAGMGSSYLTGKLSSGETFATYAPLDTDLVKTLKDKNIAFSAKPAQNNSFLSNALFYWLPTLLLIGVWVFFIRQMQSGGGKAMGFGKSKAKLLTERHGRVTFEDVAGVDEAKEDLQEIVEFLKDPHKFQRLGGKIPKGCAARRSSRHRQDASGTRHRGRGQCALLHYLGLGLRRNVRRCRCVARARHVRAGEEECALHHLHRRNRRRRPPSWRRSRRRQ